MTPQQIKDKLTFGDRVVFKRYKQPDQVLYYKNSLNDKQGFFTTGDGLATYRKDYKNIIKIGNKEINEISNMSIKEQIKKEYKKILKEQQEETLTFEKDPIEYIVQRYPSLDATLIDLMTESYRDFLTGIYVMAPKPTTFKILLHNGQSFYLIYNPKAYIAKVAGKQYHLMSLKDEEYAVKAISRLLMMGIPPSSPGPGEEQDGELDPKDEFASDMTSEPDLTAGLDDLGGEQPEGEEDLTQEPEEELQEQEEPKKKIRFRLIKEIKINNPNIPYTLDQLKKIYNLADSNNPNKLQQEEMENILIKIGFIDSEGSIKLNLTNPILKELDNWVEEERL